METNGSSSSQHEIVITRVLDAPRELVWMAWTEAEHVASWWGPEDFDTHVTALDLRPGGRWRYVMIDADGAEFPVTGVFREIVPMERIVTTDELDEGYRMPEELEFPEGVVLTVLFEEHGDFTRLTLRIAHPNADEKRKHEDLGVEEGWESTLDSLESFLADHQ